VDNFPPLSSKTKTKTLNPKLQTFKKRLREKFGIFGEKTGFVKAWPARLGRPVTDLDKTVPLS
jgi:hypothetical protein